MDTTSDTKRARASLGTWLFLTATSLTVAAMRLEGVIGDRARCRAMRDLMGAFVRGEATMFRHSRYGFIGGVAMRDPDGNIVAAYYGPGDARNTKTDYTGYSLQHRLVEAEVLVPLRRAASNELTTDAYMPLAARDTRRNQ